MDQTISVCSPGAYENCRICPRRCGVNRAAGQTGYCHAPADCYVARAALHFWEEPCLSGTRGSGTVFFSGCSLGCVYCQNAAIRSQMQGQIRTPRQLADDFLDLQEQGGHNINLVTAAHYLPHVIQALELVRGGALRIPVVYNSGGYESVESLKALEGLVDIYLPDLKTLSPERGRKYSHAEDYPSVATDAIEEMVRQTGPFELDAEGLMRRGVIVRHLILPGGREDAKAVIRYLYERYGDRIYLSLMSQYTPVLPEAERERFPELARRLRRREYDRVVDYAISLGVTNAFVQEGRVAKESFIPDFSQFS
ncbi:MAG: radical SAM protein [Firmicutes bacterium]|nr:radical SAM protein [Bacillota bacterium]